MGTVSVVWKGLGTCGVFLPLGRGLPPPFKKTQECCSVSTV